MKFIKKHKNLLFIIFAFAILTISYASNIFQIPDDTYKGFDKADEGNVIGRMALSKEKGIFYRGGITGQYYSYKYSEKDLQSDNPPLILTEKVNTLSQLYNDYINDREISEGTFHPYRTQPGGHAMLYSFLQKVSPFGGKINLALFRLLTIALSALAFALFIGWVQRNFGYTASVTTFILILLSPWMYRFAFNLWWALWSFYVPFITMLLVLERRKKKGIKLFDNKLLLYLALAIYIKFLFTGAEFITSALVTAVAPIIYYLLAEENRLKDKLLYFTKASLVAILTIIVGLLQLVAQIRYCDGSWKAGFEHVLFSYTKHDRHAEWMGNKTMSELFFTYFQESPFLWKFLPVIKVGFWFVVLLTTLISVYIWKCNKDKKQEKSYKALIITTAISIVGPLSWLFFFPAHASFHFFLDFIVWYMPYCLLAFVLWGIGLNLVVNQIRQIK